MDQQKLRSLVFDKTGVRIDVDDPVFALVALNEAVLAEAVERHVALLDQATAALVEQAGSLLPAGSLPAPAPSKAAASGVSGAERRLIGIAAGAAVLGALLVLLGQALFFKPAPAPAPVIQARELTAEQSAALRQGEKLAKIVQKLDTKTRSAIQAELQKP
ncbi:MAG: hypothetical protein ABIT83_22675 [Massilia sp.]